MSETRFKDVAKLAAHLADDPSVEPRVLRKIIEDQRADLAAARAEIERLKAERDEDGRIFHCLRRRVEQAEAERLAEEAAYAYWERLHNTSSTNIEFTKSIIIPYFRRAVEGSRGGEG